ncbi:hypothetical protein BVH74_05265 [Halopseudomonas phragmitis]|uniref:mannuronan 5-epimerase n=2 Tax=Halopseudomonas phragmitis TaxID=1931241 RepID=A0A1V0B2N1_9GAMM|nr:hypothetical protein BVH74_05265 [Halopseudomonas phragmitis]
MVRPVASWVTTARLAATSASSIRISTDLRAPSMSLSSFKRSALGLFGGLALALGSGALQADSRLPLVVLDSVDQQDQLSEQRARLEAATAVPELAFRAPAGRAEVSLLTMYSAQQGSWPFEPFVHNGLFRAIAGYQNQHPRAVVIQGGSISLQQLHAQLNNERILSRHEGGYLLHYPLMIDPDAALLIEGTQLHLHSYSGTALINRGLLSLRQASLIGYSDGRPHATDRPYRPFLMNWAGSRLRIEDSQLERLGYNEHLSRGVTSARSTQQAASVAPVQMLISGSRFEDMSVGLDLTQTLARVTGNHFSDMQQYALDASDSRLLIKGNRIEDVRNISAIRVSGRSQGRLEKNRIFRASKSAIELNALDGNLIVRDNQIGASAGYGLLLRDMTPATGLLIEDNLIGNSRLSAIDGAGLHQASIIGNRIIGTPEYAISIRNSEAGSGPLRLTGNHLERVGKAMIRVQGMHNLVLGANNYRANPVQQNLLIGDLLPFQAPLLDMTLRQGRLVELELEQVSLLPAEG